MHRVQLRTRVDEKRARLFIGKPAKESEAALLARENVTIFKPNGQRLLTLLRGALSEEASASAYPFLHWLRKHKSSNRGNFGGEGSKLRIKKNGTISNTRIVKTVSSVVIGHFDRAPRFPFCRETVFSTQRPDEWRGCLPMVKETAALFREHVPDRYTKQLDAAKRTHKAYVLPDSPFTTLTVNNCVAGSYHRDAGDYGPGFGAMAVFRRGTYRGCHLNFPAFGVGVDMQDRDVILFDPHEIHGNTPFTDTVGEEATDWERISVVFYFREKMLECLSPAQELARAKTIRGGDFTQPDLQTEDAS